MSETSKETAVTIEVLQEELERRRTSELIKDSMILEYQQALADAQYKVAMLNGQLKLATQPTE